MFSLLAGKIGLVFGVFADVLNRLVLIGVFLVSLMILLLAIY
jgi:hypothetical protein